MSLRKISFRTKSRLECVDKTSALASAPLTVCVLNEPIDKKWLAPSPIVAGTDTGEISSDESVSPVAKWLDQTVNASDPFANTWGRYLNDLDPVLNISEPFLNGSVPSLSTSGPYLNASDSLVDASETTLIGTNRCDTVSSESYGTQTDPVTEMECESSFTIPDGLVMDPLAPTALAVSTEFMDRIGSGLTLLREHTKKVQKYVWKNRKFDILKKSWKSMVNVVLIDAKDTPAGSANGLYCKFKLGAEGHKSKQLSKSKPTWCERFNLYLYDDSNLEVTVWHKGKQKSFMGRCVIDLSQLEKEKTHELWQDLECGQGSIHMLITLNGTSRTMPVDSVPTTNGVHHTLPAEDKFSWYRLDNDWGQVGELSVTLYGAEGLSALGLSGKADAYCLLELDNARVQTHTVPGTSDPTWDKSFAFAVNDVTSMLKITVKDESIINTMRDETIGKISIPLLTIVNDEKTWFELDNKSLNPISKGSSPKIQLQMSIAWNPIKASLRLLSPKTTKYTEKPPKTFNIPLIYGNLKFIKDVFSAIVIGNEHLKYVFEWDNREKSAIALGAWLIFWFFFRMWMTPLAIALPFVYFWFTRSNTALIPASQFEEDISDDLDLDSAKDDKTIKTRLYELQDLTFTIKDGIDYVVSLLQRIKNLFKFAVPYLSFLVMTVLVAASIGLYLIPINYVFMAIGIYKFTRKFLNPNRVPNNDILDFISRVPDDKMLKQWRELRVSQTSFSRSGSTKRR